LFLGKLRGPFAFKGEKKLKNIFKKYKVDYCFEGGILEPESINKNYRGLAGWPLGRVDDYGYLVEEKLIMVSWIHWAKNTTISKSYFVSDEHNSLGDMPYYDEENVFITQFTPKDIPVGEECWFSDDGTTWQKFGFSCYDEKLDEPNFAQQRFVNGKISSIEGENYKYCVPLLIAETPERAEELKDWDKQ